jgi:hypothetical protein
MTTSGTGSWTPPSLFYMEKPDGTLVAVTDGGGLLPSPPDLNTVPAESLGYSSDVGTMGAGDCPLLPTRLIRRCD